MFTTEGTTEVEVTPTVTECSWCEQYGERRYQRRTFHQGQWFYGPQFCSGRCLDAHEDFNALVESL